MGFYLIKSQTWTLQSLLILEYQLIRIQEYRGFLFQVSYTLQIIYIIYPKSSMSSSSLCFHNLLCIITTIYLHFYFAPSSLDCAALSSALFLKWVKFMPLPFLGRVFDFLVHDRKSSLLCRSTIE